MAAGDLDDWRRAESPRARVGRRIEVHPSIGSTNDRARETLDEPDGAGRAVVAEEQTGGRGRRGRRWLSAPGRNLAVSVAVRPRLAASDAWQLAAGAALAARAACAAHSAVALKWPNDLLADDGAKLGGLLVETTIDGDRIGTAVIGLGINVNWRRDEMPAEIARAATSLASLAGADIDRPGLLASYLDELDVELVAIEAGRSPLGRYRAACATLGTEVGIETPGGRVEGRAIEIDEGGALVVETSAGPVALSTGDVVRLRTGAPA